MCQYSALNGNPTLWHYNHLGKLISSGAGMVMIESTAVNKVGKISHSDLALYNPQQEKNLTKDGIHFVFPNIYVDPKIQYVARKHTIADPKCKELHFDQNFAILLFPYPITPDYILVSSEQKKLKQ